MGMCMILKKRAGRALWMMVFTIPLLLLLAQPFVVDSYRISFHTSSLYNKYQRFYLQLIPIITAMK
jgi:hypothetical protein